MNRTAQILLCRFDHSGLENFGIFVDIFENDFGRLTKLPLTVYTLY